MQGVIQGKAGGTINPARFIKMSQVADNAFLQAAAATDIIVGVSTEGTQDSPIFAQTDAATVGEQFNYHQVNTTPVVECGGTVAAGKALTSDANGKAIEAGVNEYVGAISLMSGVSGEKIKVLTVSHWKAA